MLVLVDKVVTLRPFPPDAALEAADRQQPESDRGGLDEDPWDGLRPFQARAFRSEVTTTGSGQARVCRKRGFFLSFLLLQQFLSCVAAIYGIEALK